VGRSQSRPRAVSRRGKEPAPWNQYDNALPCTAGAVEDGSGEKILTLLSEGTSMQSGVNQAMAGPLIGRYMRRIPPTQDEERRERLVD